MKNYMDIWSQMRAPIIAAGGDSGPWVFLVTLFVAFSFTAHKWLLPWLAGPLPELSMKWAKQLKGTWSAVFAAVFAGFTSPVSLENALLAILSGAAIVAFRNVATWGPRLMRYMRDQLMGDPPSGGPPAMASILIAILVSGCGAGLESPKSRQDCYLAAEKKGIAAGVEQCIDYESTADCPAWPEINDQMKSEQEACK